MIQFVLLKKGATVVLMDTSNASRWSAPLKDDPEIKETFAEICCQRCGNAETHGYPCGLYNTVFCSQKEMLITLRQ